jgi:hypothetical protein
MMLLYQVGMIKHLPEPPLPGLADAEKVTVRLPARQLKSQIARPGAKGHGSHCALANKVP